MNVSSTMKSKWSDREANSGPQWWEASDKQLVPWSCSTVMFTIEKNHYVENT